MQATAPPVPVLWLYGADAVGKSSVAWEVYDRLTATGLPLAYVDTDYLTFCRGGSVSSTARLLEVNLASVWANFAAVGSRGLVVSGVVVTREELQRYRAAIPGTVLTLCRLRAAEAEITARISHRRRLEHARTQPLGETEQRELADYAARSVHFARLLDTDDFADFTVDTTGRSVAALADEVLARAAGWPDLPDGGRSSVLSRAEPVK